MTRHIFLVGCARSGTTLAQQLVAKNFPVYSPIETSFFTFLLGEGHYRKYHPHVNFGYRLRFAAHFLLNRIDCGLGRSDKALRYLEEATGVPFAQPSRNMYSLTAAARKFNEHMGHIMTLNNQSGWLEKTPNHIYYLKEISNLIPNALFIHVVREGKAVVASLADAAINYQDEIHDFSTDLIGNCYRWNNAVAASEEFVGDDNHMIAFYEDMVTDPSLFLNQVEEHINLKQISQITPPSIIKKSEPWKSEVSDKIKKSKSKFTILFDENQQELINKYLKEDRASSLRKVSKTL